MTDVIDVAQRRQQEEIDHALAARKPVTELPLRLCCVNPDCGEPISDVRQLMHAQLCLDCQRDAEQALKSCHRGAH